MALQFASAKAGTLAFSGFPLSLSLTFFYFPFEKFLIRSIFSVSFRVLLVWLLGKHKV